MARTYRLISSDGHLEVLPERWTSRVPKPYRDRAPRTVRLPDGGDAILIEGQPLQEAFFLDLRAGRPEGQWQPFGLRIEDTAGTGSPEQRVREQEMDGLDAEVLFPAMVAGPGLWRSISHDEVYRAVIRAYNDWLAEEYCAVAPERLLGLGVIPWTNVEDAVAELHHCARQGLKGVVLGVLPSGQGYPTPADDRFWAAALDVQMPVTVHVGFNRTGPRATQPTFRYPKEPPEVMRRLRRPFLEWVAHFGLPPALSVTQLILAGVFDRFPALRVFFAETRLGWVPFWLESADLWYQRHLPWAEQYLGFQRLKELPSTYARQHIYWSVQYERVAIELRHHLGVDHILFATDFPHIECEWPNSRAVLARLYADVPAAERDRIWAGNAVDFFHLHG
ncbi:MAG: amidohydrolase [Candidatus Tectimicrobiota bacterium]|nr:MAG: amidohydrolase [Candidatus Tectomicrobia bacterium]